ncbi:hypothetical protein DUNSADRAFT_1401 [Dunaliella salina]|uniref:Uncharacterized protein n=1 Tax=Dunaliella salina TaxID=3046 RepID=A0ABQ7GX48_DUNSA|nr:hypothetical protein DUNSADRAFT_1401 [Dunaliella salina]|eukprot:KAF5839174.1 hypothetical protein DUNSADRAFT_1401 [Dunaliella salina]
MLPPVSEALGIIDVALVNNDGSPTPGSMRRAIQIMVDHISYQNVQLSRVEDILAAYGNPTQPGGTVWTKLAGKADASRVQQLEEQLDEQLNVMCAMRSKQSESDLRAEEMAARMELLRDQVASLEAKLGGGCTPARSHAQVMQHASHRDRSRAECTDGIGGMLVRGWEKLAGGCAAAQLQAQALALAAASARAEAEAEASSRSKDTEKRVMSKMHGLEEALEMRVASVSSKVSSSLSQELDKRFLGLYDHVDLQVSGLRGDLERVQQDKADTTSLEAYTARVSALFEQVAGSLGADVREASESCSKSVAALQSELAVLASTKADKVAAGSVMDAHAAALGSLRDNIAALERTIAAHPDVVESVRTEVRALAKDLEQAQRSVSGLNSAMAATGSAIELQSHKTGSLSHKLQQAVADLGRLRAMVYGEVPVGAPGGAGNGAGGNNTLGSCLLALHIRKHPSPAAHLKQLL